MKKQNFLIPATICIFIFLEIVFLRPSKIESNEQDPQGMFNSIETEVSTEKKDDPIAYTIEGFRYNSVEGEVKQWEMDAQEAMLYEKSRMSHAFHVKIKMFDPKGQATLIEGDEAFFQFGSQNVELIHNVKVTFPDDFWIKTSRVTYVGAKSEFSTTEPFYGEAKPSKDELMHMWGTGFRARRDEPVVHILKDARVQLRGLSTLEITDVRSDLADVDRFTKIGKFTMEKPSSFVESDRGTLHVKSRWQEASYDSQKSALRLMTAYDDVLIQERDPIKSKKGMKYATCQKADFLTQEDKIILTGFPSVYQQRDTITGELITIYRKRNVVEVAQANGLHEPAPPPPPRSPRSNDDSLESSPPKR